MRTWLLIHLTLRHQISSNARLGGGEVCVIADISHVYAFRIPVHVCNTFMERKGAFYLFFTVGYIQIAGLTQDTICICTVQRMYKSPLALLDLC